MPALKKIYGMSAAICEKTINKEEAMYQTILVPLDGSKRAEAILSHAELIAKQNNARVIFLKVEEGPILLDRDEVIDFSEHHLNLKKREKKSYVYLTELENSFKSIDIKTEIRISHGTVVKSILATAMDADADLIAMATHGWGGLMRVSYGSVAAGVLQAAKIPILLIRSLDDADDGEELSRT